MSRWVAGLASLSGMAIGAVAGSYVGPKLDPTADRDYEAENAGMMLGTLVGGVLGAILGAGCPTCPTKTGAVAGVGEQPSLPPLSHLRFP